MKSLIRKLLAAVVAVGVLAATAGVASADDIYNNLDGSIDAVAEVMPLNMGGPNGTTTLYVAPTGEGKNPADGKSGCNFQGSTTLTISISSSNTSVATVSRSSVTFTSCEDSKVLTVTPVAQGSPPTRLRPPTRAPRSAPAAALPSRP